MKRLYFLRYSDSVDMESLKHIPCYSEEFAKVGFVLCASKKIKAEKFFKYTIKTAYYPSLDQNNVNFVDAVAEILTQDEIPNSNVLVITPNNGVNVFYNAIKIPSAEKLHLPPMSLSAIDFFVENWENYDINLAFAKSIITS